MTEPIFVEKLLSGLRRLNRKPRVMKACRVTGLRGSDGSREWDEPERVSGHGIHGIVKGRVQIRRVSSTHAETLARIDAERAELNKRLAELNREERETLQTAWDDGKDMAVTEIKE